MQTGRLSRIVLREDAQHGRGVKLAAQDFVWCHFCIAASIRALCAINNAQCGGRPCIRGMRIRVTDVLELIAAGVSFEEIVADYGLEREDILAAVEYAAAYLKN